VFREVRRVLRPLGTLWLNLGDSYATTAPGTRVDPAVMTGKHTAKAGYMRPKTQPGLKPKDLCGIPWRVAFALQDDGWWLRRDIIWSKPNPMPESVRDRCTSAHEYLFHFAKSETYYYDADAIKDAAISLVPAGNSFANRQDEAKRGSARRGGKWTDIGGTRNKRSVWTIATAPFAEAHFATFPPALVEPCILAGCPVGGTVLDPFGGAGTVGLVADQFGRDAVLIELNPGYAAIAERRIASVTPGLPL
jgi:DNA modification methylase